MRGDPLVETICGCDGGCGATKLTRDRDTFYIYFEEGEALPFRLNDTHLRASADLSAHESLAQARAAAQIRADGH